MAKTKKLALPALAENEGELIQVLRLNEMLSSGMLLTELCAVEHRTRL